MRLNVNTQATKWLNTGVNLDGALSNRNDVPSGGTATTNPFYFTRQMGIPRISAYDFQSDASEMLVVLCNEH